MSRSCQWDNLTIRTYSCTHTFLSNQKAKTGSFVTWKCRAIEGDKASKQVSCPSLKLLMLVHFTQHNSAYHCRASWVCVSPCCPHLIRVGFRMSSFPSYCKLWAGVIV